MPTGSRRRSVPSGAACPVHERGQRRSVAAGKGQRQPARTPRWRRRGMPTGSRRRSVPSGAARPVHEQGQRRDEKALEPAEVRPRVPVRMERPDLPRRTGLVGK